MRKVYLDNTSTTPLLPEVRQTMMPYLGDIWGNPSALHDWGDAAREAIELARTQVAQLIGADSEEIIFIPDRNLGSYIQKMVPHKKNHSI